MNLKINIYVIPHFALSVFFWKVKSWTFISMENENGLKPIIIRVSYCLKKLCGCQKYP